MPPKQMGVNSNAEAARVRNSERKEREARDKETRGEGAEKRAEAAARKAEARRIAKLEEKELDKANRVSIPVPKITEAELQRRRDEEQVQILKKAEEDKRRQRRLKSIQAHLLPATGNDQSLQI